MSISNRSKFAFLPRLTVTRRSLDIAVRISTLIFTLIYSTSLYLLTTAPEEITAGLEDLMSPLRRLNLPISEITLTLTLSLRFIPLVLEEVQNLVRSIRTRAIRLEKAGGTSQRSTVADCFGEITRKLIAESRANCYSNGCSRFYHS